MIPNDVLGPERMLTAVEVLTLPLTGVPPLPLVLAAVVVTVVVAVVVAVAVLAVGREAYPEEIQPPFAN
jgi:hypothetical protein